jgi:hypothetical protein
MEGFVTDCKASGVVRCVAIDPRRKTLAVASEFVGLLILLYILSSAPPVDLKCYSSIWMILSRLEA